MRATFVPAGAGDEAPLLEFMREFYREEGIPFQPRAARSSLRELARRPEWGRVFVIRLDGRAAGYLVVTLGYSVEFRGRYLVLDELFLCRAFRGRGFGRAALRFTARWAREQGLATVRLEVNRHNKHAARLYGRAGFFDQRRRLLTRRLRA